MEMNPYGGNGTEEFAGRQGQGSKQDMHHNLHEDGDTIERKTEAKRLVTAIDAVSLSSEHGNKSTLGGDGDGNVNRVAVDGEAVDIGGGKLNVEGVLGVLVGNLQVEGGDTGDTSGRNLTLLEGLNNSGSLGHDVLPGLEDGGTQNNVVGGLLNVHTLLLDKAVQPRGIDGVLLELLGLQKLNEVLHGRADLTTDLDLLQGQHKRLASSLPGGTLGEQMAELRIGKLVDATVGTDAEVSPNVRGRLELDPLDGARGGLESLVGVLGGDAGGDDVGVDVLVLVDEEVDGVGAVDVLLAVQLADSGDVVKRNAHGNLELGGGEVGAGDALGDGMLYLETGVELEEEVVAGVGVEEVLDGTGSDVADGLGEALGGALHLAEGFGGDDDGGSLLEDLLEAALGGAIASVESDGVAVLVADDLDLDVAGVLTELHEEDGGADDLVGDLNVGVLEVLLVVDEADALAAAALGGLDHDAVLVADVLGGLDGLLDGAAGGLLEDLVGDGALVVELGLEGAVVGPAVRAGPGDGGNAGGLGEDVGGDLVAEDAHDGPGRADELDAHGLEGVGELGILGGVSPAGPDGVDAVLLSDLGDDVDVGVVVEVLAGGDLDEGVGQPNELGVGLEVLGGGHGDELDGVLVAQLHVGPLPHRQDGLGGGHTVVGDEDLLDGEVAAAGLDVVLEGGAGAGGLGLDGRHRQLGAARRGVMRNGHGGAAEQSAAGGLVANERRGGCGRMHAWRDRKVDTVAKRKIWVR